MFKMVTLIETNMKQVRTTFLWRDLIHAQKESGVNLYSISYDTLANALNSVALTPGVLAIF